MKAKLVSESVNDIFKPKSKDEIIRNLYKLSQYELNDKLRSASGNGHKDVVSMLLDAGAQVDAKDNSGSTALMIASWNGHKDVVEVLKKHGAKE